MSVTFDQLLETFTKEREPEPDTLQGDAHGFGACLWEWSQGNLSNANFIATFGVDNTDTEVGTVKTYVQALPAEDQLALHYALMLAEKQVTGYDKSYLRTRFGLT